MRKRRMWGVAALVVGLVLTLGFSVRQLFAGTPESDAERKATIDSMAYWYSWAYPDVPHVTAQELAAERDTGDGPLVVDTRTPEEQAVSMLPGAITKEQYEAARAQYAGRDVVTYCTIGYRSGRYAAELRAAGIDASNLEGSLLAWTHAGQPLETPDGEATKRLHVYGPTWDLAPAGYEGIY